MVILLIGYTLFFNNKSDGNGDKPNIIYNYTTDTIFIKKTFSQLKKDIDSLNLEIRDLKKTPPKQIITYKPENPQNVVIEKIPDSVLVLLDSLKTRVAISDNFFKLYPNSSKLLYMELQKENLSLTTLNIEGKIKQKEYPLDLDYYKYIYDENQLNHYRKSNIEKERPKTRFDQLYINGGYDYILSEPMFGVDYQIIFRRLKLQTQINSTLNENPKLRADILLGYRLFK